VVTIVQRLHRVGQGQPRLDGPAPDFSFTRCATGGRWILFPPPQRCSIHAECQQSEGRTVRALHRLHSPRPRPILSITSRSFIQLRPGDRALLRRIAVSCGRCSGGRRHANDSDEFFEGRVAVEARETLALAQTDHVFVVQPDALGQVPHGLGDVAEFGFGLRDIVGR
jgi:hypothetical protein